jgi:hypothetical protein
MMSFTYISGLLQLVSFVFFLHPIHVTVTEIEHDEKDKRLEIMLRVFIDDLELGIRKDLNQPELDLVAPKNNMATDEMIAQYVAKHLKISLDNKVQKLTYLGHEQEDDAFILYIEGPNAKKWKTINITNDFLTELHDDQSNLVHVTVKGTVKSLRLTRDTPSDKLTFDTK